MTVWDACLSQQDEAVTRARIGRLRWYCQMFRLLAFQGKYKLADDYIDMADKYAEKHRIAWGAWYE